MLLFGGGDEQGLKQTLCGLERADGTPLGTLLSKGRPGTEHREVDAAERRVSCQISVDGEKALSVVLFDADLEAPEEGGHATAKDMIGRGVLASGPGAGVTEYCAGDHSRAFTVTVIADTSVFLKPNADRDALTKALGSLTGKVAAEQQHEVCR
ncbi:hypothetical protein OG535_08175 [Kitasatospora sp. NBC_00085]|uniref:hypothetical protein n=1 Tax=unclassified Kitasatospora TaxID=2633591 RepID=UPI003256949A